MFTTRRHFSALWLAEAIRLQESRKGPYQDSQINRQAIATATDFQTRLLCRAQLLGKRENLHTPLTTWIKGGRLTLLLLILFALITGVATALGVLTQDQRQINLFIALLAFLGLSTASFLFWLISLALPQRQATTLGNGWLWLSQRLNKAADHNRLVGQALLSLLSRSRILAPLFGSISHLLWLIALSSATLTTLGLLSTRRYAFNWETTILNPELLVKVVKFLGWLPAQLGFQRPDDSIILLSDGFHQLPDIAQIQWSSWLIGSLVCYGILLRLIALLITGGLTLYRVRKLQLDPKLPGFLELKSQLEPTSIAGSIDAPAPNTTPLPPTTTTQHVTHSIAAIVGIELASDFTWPPQPLNETVTDFGIIDTRHQRQELLTHLHQYTPERLLCVCDPYQTPDRGTRRLLAELQEHCQAMRILLHSPHRSESDEIQIDIWQSALSDINHGLLLEHNLSSAWQWLQEAA